MGFAATLGSANRWTLHAAQLLLVLQPMVLASTVEEVGLGDDEYTAAADLDEEGEIMFSTDEETKTMTPGNSTTFLQEDPPVCDGGAYITAKITSIKLPENGAKPKNPALCGWLKEFNAKEEAQKKIVGTRKLNPAVVCDWKCLKTNECDFLVYHKRTGECQHGRGFPKSAKIDVRTAGMKAYYRAVAAAGSRSEEAPDPDCGWEIEQEHAPAPDNDAVIKYKCHQYLTPEFRVARLEKILVRNEKKMQMEEKVLDILATLTKLQRQALELQENMRYDEDWDDQGEKQESEHQHRKLRR